MSVRRFIACLILLVTPVLSFAQGQPIQVTVQLLPPYSNDLSDYLSTGDNINPSFQEKVLVTLINTDPNRTYALKLRSSVTGNNGISAEINPDYQPVRRIILPPGGSKVISGKELSQINRNLTDADVITSGFNRDDLVRTGNLPEGLYQVCVQAFDFETNQPLSAQEPQGCSPFIEIANPDPPFLVYPYDGANITPLPLSGQQLINMSWTPASRDLTRVRYRVRMIEINAINANPYDVFDQTSISFYQEEGLQSPNLIYDQTKPLLQEGNTYAFRVQAYDPMGELQFKNNGLSEIAVFTYGASGTENRDPLAQLSGNYVNLNPGYIRLDVSNTSVTDNGTANVYNGQARLQVFTPDNLADTAINISVQVNNLQVRKGSPVTSPDIIAGSVSGTVNQLPRVLAYMEPTVEVKRIRWEASKSTELEITADIEGPDGKTYEAFGGVGITPQGVSGRLSVKADPLFTLGSDPVELDVTEIGAFYPQKMPYALGRVRYFGDSPEALESCEVDIDGFTPGSSIQVNCQIDESIRLAGDDGTHADLAVAQFIGTLTPDFEQETLGYDLQGLSKLTFTTSQSNCGMNVTLNLKEGEGVKFVTSGPTCGFNDQTLDLGMVKAEFSDLKLEKLQYQKANGWSFTFNMDAQLIIPPLNDYKLPQVNDMKITENGVDFPAFNFQQTARSEMAQANTDGFNVYLNSFSSNGFNLPYFDYDYERIGEGTLDMMASGTVNFPDSEEVPQCLKGASIELGGAIVKDTILVLNLSGDDIGDCTWEFGSGYALKINAIQGSVSYVDIKNTDKENVGTSRIFLDAALLAGDPFACEGTANEELLSSRIRVRGDRLSGTVENLVPSCPVEVGPFMANITSSTLFFQSKDSRATGQYAYLLAEASLQLPEISPVNGIVGIDLMAGELDSVEFSIDEPFMWHIPENEPMLSFRVNEAKINANGLFIDGRNTLYLRTQPGKAELNDDDETSVKINATFDELLLDLQSKSIASGQVIFDNTFAFEAGIDETTRNVSFKAVPIDEPLSFNPAAYLELGSVVTLDSAGIATSGTAAARLAWDQQDYDADVRVEFKNNFKLGLYPPGVRRGRAEVYYNEDRLAYFDPDGVHLDVLQIAESVVPDTIPLPSNDVAYLVIKQNDQFVVDVTNNQDGTLSIDSKPNQPLELHVPALDPANPPQVSNVTLNNVTITANAENPQWIDGSVEADILPGNQLRTLAHQRQIPLTPDKITFGKKTVGGVDLTALHLDGNVYLFNQDLPNGRATFSIQSDGVAQASLDLNNIDESVELVENSNRVTLNLNGISGWVDVPLNNTANKDFQLDLDGSLQVNLDNNTLAAKTDMGLRYTPGNVTVTRFRPDVSADLDPLDLEYVSLELKEIPNLKQFDYDPATGEFAFEADLNLDINFHLDKITGETGTFSVPLRGITFSNTGLRIPQQTITDATVPGMDIPALMLAGVTVKPLSLRSTGVATFNWYDPSQTNLNFQPRFDFEVRLPAFAGTGLVPPDGFTFTNVGFNAGVLTGGMSQPWQFSTAIPIGLDPNNPDGPELNVAEVFGELKEIVVDGEIRQDLEFALKGFLDKLPKFEQESEVCVNPTFDFKLVEGKGFEGSVNDFTPCGKLPIGPLTLEAVSTDLTLAYREGEQSLTLGGTLRLNKKENPYSTGIADGVATIDLLTAQLVNGYVEINRSFPFSLPVDSEDPFFEFTINQARLDTAGFMFTGNGSWAVNDALTNQVVFNDFRLGLDNFRIKSGSANLGSNAGIEMELNPVKLSMVNTSKPRPANDHLRLDLSANLVLDKDGLGYEGTSTAFLRALGTDYPSLRTEYKNSFALDINTFKVNRGYAEFYRDTGNVQSSEPLAILDENGFRLGGGITALLPDTLGLPTKDVAFLVLKDQAGNELVDFSSSSGGGYIINNKPNTPLDLVFASLQGNAPDPPVAKVTFSLNTDSYFNPNGGSLTLESSVDLEPYLNIPVKIDRILADFSDNTSLGVGITADLPESMGNLQASADAYVSSTGFKQADIELGQYHTSYIPDITKLHSFTHSATIGNASETDEFTLHIDGIRLRLGNTKGVQLCGTFESTLLQDKNDNSAHVFYKGEYTNGNWDASIDASEVDSIPLGVTHFIPEENNPFTVNFSDDEFTISLSGLFSFEDLVGEPLKVSVSDVLLGVTDVQAQPKLVFAMGSAATTLPDQQLALFDDAILMNVLQPTVGIQNREVTFTADGDLQIMEEQVTYTGLKLSTATGFSVQQVNTQDIDLIEDYVALKSVGFPEDSEGKLSFTATVGVTLPDPVGTSADATINISRDPQRVVNIDVQGPSFDLGDDATIALSEKIDFKLTKVAVDLNFREPLRSGIYANGEVLFDGVSRIQFGDDADIYGKPGIGLESASTMVRAFNVRYNVTGNYEFNYNEGFFDITIRANAAVSDDQSFQVVLGGTAGVTIEGVGGALSYKGLTITKEGIVDRGQLDLAGGAELTLMEFAKLSIGPFQYLTPDEGADYLEIELAKSGGTNPSDLQNKAENGGGVDTETIRVTRYLQFGSPGSTALDISFGGQNPDEEGGGGFGGGVEMVVFYQKYNPNGNGGFFLSIDQANIKVGNNLDVTGSMQLETDGNGGVSLRAMLAGSFESGTTSAGAVVVGSFSNLNGQVRFGLFAGVSATPGIPIVPGVVDITGAAGGFFYNPEQADIDLVYTAMQAAPFEYTTTKSRLTGTNQPPQATNYKFAVMLFAQVGIAGGGGAYVVDGKVFLQLTDQSIYLDVQGAVLGMGEDSSSPLKAEAGMFVEASLKEFMINGGVQVSITYFPTLEGEMGLTFVLGESPVTEKILWGIDGSLDITLLKILHPYGTFLACNDGFFMEIGLNANVLDFPVITIKGSLSGSIWHTTNPSFRLPFGAYGKLEIELCLIACASIDAKAVFAGLGNNRYKLVAGAELCGSTPFGDACVYGKGWAELKGSAGNMDLDWGGDIGTGRLSDRMFDEAENVEQQFRDLIADIKAELEGLKQEMEKLENMPTYPDPVIVSTQTLRKAGLTIHGKDYGAFAGYGLITLQSERAKKPLPSQLDWVNDYVIAGNKITGNSSGKITQSSDYYTEVTQSRQQMEEDIEESTQLLEEAIVRLNEVIITATEYKAASTNAFENLLTLMESNPVSNVQKQTNVNQGLEPGFTIDQQTAESQQEEAADFTENLETQEQAFADAINSLEANLKELDELLTKPLESSSSSSSGSGSVTSTQTSGTGIVYLQNTSTATYSGNLTYTLASGGTTNWANLDISSLYAGLQPDINSVAKGMRKAMSSIDLHYAKKANYLWMKRRWASQTLEDLKYRRSSIQSGVSTLYNAAINKGTSYAKNHSGDMLYNQYVLAQETSVGSTQKTDHEDRLQALIDGNKMSAFKDDYERVAMDSWYNLHELALWDLQKGYASEVTNEMRPNQHITTRRDLRSLHSNLTEKIDEAYTLKADFMGILYGFYNKYASVRELYLENASDSLNTAQDSLILAIDARQQEIADQLEPPVVSDVKVSSVREGYYNKTKVTWTTSAEPIETSVQIDEYVNRDGAQLSEGFYNYLSVGDASSVELYPYRTSFNRDISLEKSNPEYFNTKKMAIGIRLRSQGGTTILRKASFDVKVGPGGEGQDVVSSESVLIEDNTPPSLPITNIQPTQTSFGFYNNHWWTNDNQVINIYGNSQDLESDISHFDYAIGSSEGATDIVDWTRITGEQRKRFYANGLTTEIRGKITSLTLEEDKTYYISIRAVNGAGMSSPVFSDQYGLKYDASVPGNPRRRNDFSATYFTSSYVFAPVKAPETQEPEDYYGVSASANDLGAGYDYLQNKFNNAPMPTLNASWLGATDSESGIEYYQYLVTKQAQITEADFDERLDDETTTQTYFSDRAYNRKYNTIYEVPQNEKRDNWIQRFGGHGEITSYVDSLYVHVRAKNHAGSYSEIITLGPKLIKDPSGPNRPDVEIINDLNELTVHITNGSVDAESGLAGYQYAVGTSSNLTNVRKFPTSGKPDYESNNAIGVLGGTNDEDAIFGLAPVRFTIPKSNLPQGEFYVFVRAVNHQGKGSGAVGVGPFLIDDTAPPQPSLDLNFNESDEKVTLTLNNINDPESGIAKVEYRLDDNTISLYGGYKDLWSISGVRKNSFGIFKTISTAGYNSSQVKVYIRLTNGVGKQTVISQQVTNTDVLMFNTNNTVSPIYLQE